ncbi:tRNA (adenosine(37)-N6)-threonylcarbamoyltransferase complex dimerization subunit type 1 TsaB [Streptococcus sp. SG1]|jgi:universal bacterial protein yeaZ|uniref:tRNA (adenosine(37)-N6)-threonylcarbamoyltransferase complex dimerization subunit type 1 TsaB n=1 Tax=Streptococcus TaxID=1301 RepID=UPI0009C24080|nr:MULTISPECIES: tRNA (adenosine(37)-N6)-threonylcarbamoyltransferase complex dimerization subunit type 1 TsaB [Streptococcus]ARC46431.1 tRNA (adenosine(37)-N6)-threonylcarbamoyltransferase complex dimerization subunit type 1 TsaB [Streptococcus gordonii]MDN5018891.1 tRNA (adenosine(37)-N6)-threonylcarbamoyltransferase complex dimerization subunit type 1 TsaB [Streptococcus sp. SG1]MDU3102555.1 tRNA (adenosine(37)-N6)-threonylcarbamoyltransferase complex dimerization subunit type 1 TsaB [Strepto
MKLLAFDTSNQALSLAILEDEHLLAQTTLNIKKNHSITLMPAIDFLMNSLDMKPTDLDRIAVAQGPGSYTGLRIAVATAKTLAHTLKIELVGVSSLLALVPEQVEGLVIPIVDARRNNVYAGFYQSGQAVRPEAHLPLAEVLEIAGAANQSVTFVGETTAFVEQIKDALPQAAIQSTLPDASTIGRIGLDLPAQSIHDFVPNYLKRVEAEENWLKTHQESSDSYIQRL